MNNDPKSQETNLIAHVADTTGQPPLLNRPHHASRTSFTGYRTPYLAAEAKAYVESLTSIPNDNPYELGKDWDGQGTDPANKLLRGLIEITMETYLENIYPEWIGDAYDDASACIEALMILNGVKEYGWESFYDWVKSEDAPPSFMLPAAFATLFPFPVDEDGD